MLPGLRHAVQSCIVRCYFITLAVADERRK